MSRTSQLYDLQQIDSGLDSRVSRMRQIDEAMASSPRLDAARSSHEDASKLLATEQARLKEASQEVESATTRMRALEKRLYDGSIKNPKELAQAQEEVTHLKSRVRSLEDAAIEAMMSVEAAEDVAKRRQEELDEVAQEWEQYQSGLMEEKDKLLSQAKVLQVKRQRAITEMPWADLQVYERMRRSKGGIAVVAVRQGLCGGCHVAVPPHILRQARSTEEPVTCPSCGRILYPVDEIHYKERDTTMENIDR